MLTIRLKDPLNMMTPALVMSSFSRIRAGLNVGRRVLTCQNRRNPQGSMTAFFLRGHFHGTTHSMAQNTIFLPPCADGRGMLFIEKEMTMTQPRNTFAILVLALLTPLMVLDGWLFNHAHAIEVEIELTIRDSRYTKTKWAPPQEGASVVLTIKNEDDIRHGFTSPLFHNLLVRTLSDGVQIYGKGIEGLYLDPGATIQLRFQVDRPGDYEFKCDLHPSMKGELLLLHVDVV
jgi:uncharacterized cupredoxin-like copper-binding protein